jgi:hypothetical protein
VEILAQALHADYLRGLGPNQESNPSAVPWERLPAALRESNRQNVLDIGRKLQAVGCRMEPLSVEAMPLFEFTPAEVEQLSEMEHERWMAERIAAGWRASPHRDVQRKKTPYLVPYAQLPESVKEYDRATVRAIPGLLAGAGFAVTRSIGPSVDAASKRQ